MSGFSILNNFKITKCSPYAAAGQNDSTGTIIDMAGFQNALFLANLGVFTAAGVATLTVKAGNTTGSSAATALTPSATATETTGGAYEGGVLALEIVDPKYRYYWPILTLATQNCVVDNVQCIQGGAARNLPVSQSTTIVNSTVCIGITT